MALSEKAKPTIAGSPSAATVIALETPGREPPEGTPETIFNMVSRTLDQTFQEHDAQETKTHRWVLINCVFIGSGLTALLAGFDQLEPSTTRTIGAVALLVAVALQTAGFVPLLKGLWVDRMTGRPDAARLIADFEQDTKATIFRSVARQIAEAAADNKLVNTAKARRLRVGIVFVMTGFLLFLISAFVVIVPRIL